MSEVRLDFSLPSEMPRELPVISLIQGVLLPGSVIPFTVGRQRSLNALAAAADGLVLVVPQREPLRDPGPSDLLPTGTLARIVDIQDGTGRAKGRKVALTQGLARVELTGFPRTRPVMSATFSLLQDQWPETAEAQGTMQAFEELVEEVASDLGISDGLQRFRHLFTHPGMRIDAVAALLDVPGDWKRDILTTLDPVARAEKAMSQLIRAREVITARKAVRDRLNDEMKGNQREMFLRQQMAAIQKELGEGSDTDELDVLGARLDDAELPDRVRQSVDKELKRLGRLNAQSPERSVAIDWLEWIADLPWSVTSAVDVDLDGLEQALNHSHYGLDEVKRQVVEYLAVRKLAGTGRADVLLLAGPPGVGKTSIAQAVADATGRNLVRVALGGMRDEAELRGHRRTYIGARPGRLVEGIRSAGTADPVVLLDEIDKVSMGGVMGNPAAALLEILDPEQNHTFVDRYLEVPFDLSRALFVATANDLSTIPRPLLDRMEILNIAGYTPEEKQRIAKDHLLPQVATNAGLEASDVSFTDEALRDIIEGWTRESGVRQLQRQLGRLYRAAAVKRAKNDLDEPLEVTAENLETYLKRRKFHIEDHDRPERPGIATGLAWTPVGGDVLYVEASTMPGNGKLVLTGQLGDVMKESARAALTYVLAHAERLDIPLDAMADNDVHIHVPAGAVPKDGPSAGVTMFTTLASLLSNRRVRPDTAMTGEATLRGRVLPVGGIKEKVLAAHRRGLTRIILPYRNEADLDDVPQSVRDAMTFVLVKNMDEVLVAALVEEGERPRDVIAA